MLALRGIGNAGFATAAIPDLEMCLLAGSNPVEVRVSAIQAFRRMPCDSSVSIDTDQPLNINLLVQLDL